MVGTNTNGPRRVFFLGTTTGAFAQCWFRDRGYLEPLGVPHLGRIPNDPGQKIMPKMQDSSPFVFFKAAGILLTTASKALGLESSEKRIRRRNLGRR